MVAQSRVDQDKTNNYKVNIQVFRSAFYNSGTFGDMVRTKAIDKQFC